jgi:hypothetical protein
VATVDHGRVDEVLMEMVDVLDHPSFHRATDGDVVEHRQVLCVLAEADTTGMRTDGDAELGGQQQDSQNLVDTPQSAGVQLAEPDGIGLE